MIDQPTGAPLCTTVSIGIARAERGDMTTAVALADRRHYAAKAAGRNRVDASGPDTIGLDPSEPPRR